MPKQKVVAVGKWKGLFEKNARIDREKPRTLGIFMNKAEECLQAVLFAKVVYTQKHPLPGTLRAGRRRVREAVISSGARKNVAIMLIAHT